MILERGAEPEDIELRGIEAARPTPEGLDAIERAEAIVIGPSNPVISIGPILAVPGMRHALAAASAPVIAVSPFVGGNVLKGPTEAFCRMAGLPLGSAAVEQAYAGVVDGLVADEEAPSLPTRLTDVLMDTPEARQRVAEETLGFAQTLK
jgi:LPPG:FO 2-phospho-L-lactate transferase